MNSLADNLALATYVAAPTASLLALAALFLRHIDGRPLVPYEPRRRVPWNGWAALLLVTPMLLNVVSRLATMEPPAGDFAAPAKADDAAHDAPSGDDSEHFIRDTALTSLTLTLLAVAVWAGLATLTGATAHDLGFPANRRQLARDVGLGSVAFLATLTPIYFLQIVLSYVIEPEHGHPFVEEFSREPSLGLILGIGFAAVVAAPVFEETAFRLVLLGWLEKAELAGKAVEVSAESEQATAAEDVDGAACSSDMHVVQADPSPSRGWLPITASGMLFGLAHWGHGVAPVPLALLGIVLGYLYHRTHRIVPSITCHLLFNGLTMWLLLLEYLRTKGT